MARMEGGVSWEARGAWETYCTTLSCCTSRSRAASSVASCP